jgi:Uma2 family endonuclease
MSTIVSDEPILYDQRFVREDLASMPDDGRRYELIDGMLIVNAAPVVPHQDAVLAMGMLLKAACPPALKVLVAPFSVGLSIETDIQPDVLVARRDRLTPKDLPGVPELVVEVVSYSTRLLDLHLKRERFERAGCPSYWVVHPSARPEDVRLTAWQLDAGKRYERIADVSGGQEFRAAQPCPVTVVPATLAW